MRIKSTNSGGFIPNVVLTAALPGLGMPFGSSGKDGEGKKPVV